MTESDIVNALNNRDNLNVMASVIRGYGEQIPSSQHPEIMRAAVTKCLYKHDEKYGQKFTTSLHRLTMWECSYYLRDQEVFWGNKVSMDFSTFPAPINGQQEEIDHIRECLGKLPDRDKDLITKFFFMGMTLTQIGEEFGYTKQAADGNIKRAIGRLKNLCNKSV